MELDAIRSQALLRSEAQDRLDLGAHVHHTALAVHLGDARAHGFEDAEQAIGPIWEDGQRQVGPRGRQVLEHDLLELRHEAVGDAMFSGHRNAPAKHDLRRQHTRGDPARAWRSGEQRGVSRPRAGAVSGLHRLWGIGTP